MTRSLAAFGIGRLAGRAGQAPAGLIKQARADTGRISGDKIDGLHQSPAAFRPPRLESELLTTLLLQW